MLDRVEAFCSGVSAERRQTKGIEECGFLPKAATPARWQTRHTVVFCPSECCRGRCQFKNARFHLFEGLFDLFEPFREIFKPLNKFLDPFKKFS
jgi:hypothetical protein